MTDGRFSEEDVILREYRSGEYEDLLRLWERAGLPYKPKGRDRREAIEKEASETNAVFLIAEAQGGVVGSVLGTHDGRKGWINRLAVAPELRRLGIGKMLVEEVERRLSKVGIEIIACLIEDWNSESIRFFENLGYVRQQDVHYFTKRRHPDI